MGSTEAKSSSMMKSVETIVSRRGGQLTRDEQKVAAADRRWRLAFAAEVSMIITVLLAGSLLVWPLIDKTTGNTHYVVLAHNLLRGNLTLDGMVGQMPDVATYNGHMYLPLGPLPAVLLIPFLPLLDNGVRLVWVGHLLTLINVWLLYKILKKIDVGSEQRKWCVLLFFGGTVYLGLAFEGSTWGLDQIATVTFLLAAMLEGVTGKRPLLMGLLLGIAGMARFTAIFALPFFVVLLWKAAQEGRASLAPAKLFGKLAPLLMGLAIPLALLALYNYARFGNVLDTGYGRAEFHKSMLEQARSYGLFSLVHVPKNLVMMLFQGPEAYPSADAPVLQFPYLQPSHWGMGIFFTSPALVYIFRTKLREPLVLACWLAVICVMVPVITYYGIGWEQVGYRYALDFTPFLVLLTARGMPNPMNNTARVLIIVSLLVGLWGCMFLSTLGR